MSEHWLVLCAGQQYGPVDEATVAAWIREGRVHAVDHVWRPGMAQWQRVDAVTAFAGPPRPPARPDSTPAPPAVPGPERAVASRPLASGPLTSGQPASVPHASGPRAPEPQPGAPPGVPWYASPGPTYPSAYPAAYPSADPSADSPVSASVRDVPPPAPAELPPWARAAVVRPPVPAAPPTVPPPPQAQPQPPAPPAARVGAGAGTSGEPPSAYAKGGYAGYPVVPGGPSRAERAILPVGRTGLAIAAGYAGLVGFLVPPVALISLILGILALRQLARDPDKLGRGRAIFGIAAFGFWVVIALAYAITR